MYKKKVLIILITIIPIIIAMAIEIVIIIIIIITDNIDGQTYIDVNTIVVTYHIMKSHKDKLKKLSQNLPIVSLKMWLQIS